MYTLKNSLFPVWIHLFPFWTYIMPHWNTLKDITNIIVIRKDCVTYFEIRTFLCILITEGFYFLHLLILPNQFAKKLNKLFLFFSTCNKKKLINWRMGKRNKESKHFKVVTVAPDRVMYPFIENGSNRGMIKPLSRKEQNNKS